MKLLKRILLLIISTFHLIRCDDQIIIHVVPHSHDDAGWLFTFDEYYNGNNEDEKCVKCIYDSILDSLLKNENRTFVAVEIAFFSKWYKRLSDEKKNNVKKLIENGKWEFANAGWVLHDEATTYYKHFLDNMRLGLKFIKSEFNKTVETAWFIDPFGHSSANVFLFLMLGCCSC